MTTRGAERLAADPRPRAVQRDGGVAIDGWRCAACSHPITQPVLCCPVCRGQVEEAGFATDGEVWASTCLRVRVPGHDPPLAVAYIVLDDAGPRILVHTTGHQPLTPGSRARVVEVTADGDVVAEQIEEVAR